MASMTIPVITTPRLTLRAFTEEDVEPMVRTLNGRGVLRYFPKTDPLPRDRVQSMISGLLEHWEERGYGLWAVESRPDGALMGRCGLQFQLDICEVEVGYILGREFWGKGFATEAGRASVRYGFDELGLESVAGITNVENKASQRVLEKLGMELLEQRRFSGMECYRYALERSVYHIASQSWEGAARSR